MGHKDPGGPTAPGADHPLVAPLFTEFSDVFSESVFPPESLLTHDIELLDPDA